MTGAAVESRFGESEEPGMDPNDLRIGDAEREQTMAALREHFAQGRLDHEELDERLERVLSARTARDLAQVTADLPGHQPKPAYREPAPQHNPPGFPGDFHDKDAWKLAMRAHRHQMRDLRHSQRRGGRGWGHGPRPILPILLGFVIVGLIFGGFGVAKVLLVVWLVAMIFAVAHRRSHHRRD